jgi:glutaredoxin 3
VEFVEYDITLGGPKRAEMMERKPDAYTVPQVFIDGRAVGGSDDLARLDCEGKLDALLGS